MNKKYLVAGAGAAMLVVFVASGYFYQSQQTQQTQAMATTGDSPLVRSYSQSLGPADAKVVVVEFFDPGCETCAVFAPKVKSLVNSYDGKVRLVLRYAPFHQGADVMVRILEAARMQGLYWETLDLMFATLSQWASHHHPQPDRIWEFLPRVPGIDIPRIKQDMNDPRIHDILARDMADGRTLGVRKTPTFLVNGKPLPTFGLAQLQTLIQKEVNANY